MIRSAVQALPATEAARKAIEEFRARLRAAAERDLVDIILYGSVARGEAGPDSDVDLLVRWKGDESEGRKVAGDIAFDVFLRTDVLISIHVVNEPHWQTLASWRTSFFQNIEREGILLGS